MHDYAPEPAHYRSVTRWQTQGDAIAYHAVGE